MPQALVAEAASALRCQVKSVDTLSIDAFHYSVVLQAVQELNLRLPVLAVTGTPRLSGDVSIQDVEAGVGGGGHCISKVIEIYDPPMCCSTVCAAQSLIPS